MDLGEPRGLDRMDGATGGGHVSSPRGCFPGMDTNHSQCWREEDGLIMTGELYIGNIPYKNQDEVRGMFEEFGEVMNFSVFSQYQAKDGQLLADALVQYKTFGEAQHALHNLHNCEPYFLNIQLVAMEHADGNASGEGDSHMEDNSHETRKYGRQQEEYDISEAALRLRLQSTSGGTRKDSSSVNSSSAQGGAPPLDGSNPPRNASFLFWTDPDAPSYGDEVFISGEAFEKFLAEDERAVEVGTDLPQTLPDFTLNSAYLREVNGPFGDEAKSISVYLGEKSGPLGNLEGNGEKPFFGPWPMGSCYAKQGSHLSRSSIAGGDRLTFLSVESESHLQRDVYSTSAEINLPEECSGVAVTVDPAQNALEFFGSEFMESGERDERHVTPPREHHQDTGRRFSTPTPTASLGESPSGLSPICLFQDHERSGSVSQ
ncbi:unnamed protein product [Darwinula stevensoni]|uniref:RRM domain-containing protein n=1 Tax=Darwinula stevensoni TaxID=69355 RepID=A0A7R9A6S3_9CRUS|nr:unnamed protein product [Darwinula stevensoni]CAG0890187.1 unnamed protein product [Darwinula stevensoni]